MLQKKKIPYAYREYREDPLSAAELKALFRKLGMSPAGMLRRNDKAYRDLALTGRESDAALIGHMARHPTLLQRPVAVLGRKAVVGRPPERILELLDARTAK